ncbi:MAG TPA: response regulator transcription factor [Candidatus Cybelea sp.]|jgi:DNA-binding NarL/FixJ family response regulator|nr:response regulator transcription factor [Candidatus Cybelea sp.]
MISVSVVDDESSLSQSIALFINGSPGFRCVSTFPSGEAALAGFPAQWPDVILMDIHLSGMSGIECARRLKMIRPEVQIVMLTVYEDPEKIFAALEAGASGYMLKRLTPARLLQAIQEVHEGGSPMSHSIARKVLASFHQAGRAEADRDRLSPREEMVLDCLAKGLTYEKTSSQLNISLDSVRTYVRRIYEKLHVHSRTEAVAKYSRS